ncbi:MAG: transposase [Armatimonadetes bacterium]|nr:transposase [Armatimonadota bacterium]
MSTQRRRFSAEFKAKVAVEAIKGQRTVNEIASHYGVHPSQIAEWKKQALAGMPDVFATRRSRAEADAEALTAQLYQQIGQLKVELDWLIKKSGTLG